MKGLDILELRKLYNNDMAFLTSHCSLRLEQRNITEDDIESALNNGEIIEQYPDDYPWPYMHGFKWGCRKTDHCLLA